MNPAAPQAWLWPRFGQVFPIELALSVGVIAAACVAILGASEPAFYKARFTEVWWGTAPGKYEVVERIAYGVEPARSEVDEVKIGTRYVASRRIEGLNVTFAGEIPGFAGYQVTFYPEVAEGAAVALWHCGRSNLPQRLLTYDCRVGSRR